MHSKVYYIVLMDVIKVLKERRKKLGITQNDLSQMSDISIATIKDIERGSGNPSLRTLVKICDILGMELKCTIKDTVL